MITSIKLFEKYNKSKQFDGKDLIIINGNDNEELIKYAENFSRVFQINNKKNENDYPNQVSVLNFDKLALLEFEDIQYLFTEPMQDAIKSKFNKGFDERDLLETINGDYYIYLGKTKWFICKPEMIQLFKSFKEQERTIILVGTNYTHTFYTILRAFDVNVEYNLEFIKESVETKELHFIGTCDRLRINNPANELKWHDMIKNKKEIPLYRFLYDVDFSGALDDGETITEFIDAMPNGIAYTSNWGNKKCMFLQDLDTNFEYIFV